MKAHGVLPLLDHIEGRIGLAEARAIAIRQTRAYARRQRIFARAHLSGAGWRWIADADQAADCLP
jgi:tRNA A37 N6-isopentenylltransferase MiaA